MSERNSKREREMRVWPRARDACEGLNRLRNPGASWADSSGRTPARFRADSSPNLISDSGRMPEVWGVLGRALGTNSGRGAMRLCPWDRAFASEGALGALRPLASS